MLPTLAFAPRAEDLEEGFFDAPVMAFAGRTHVTTPAPEAAPPKAAPARPKPVPRPAR